MNKEKLKQLRRIAAQLPPIYEQKVGLSDRRITAYKLTETGRIDPTVRQIQSTNWFTVSHINRLKKAIQSDPTNGIDNYLKRVSKQAAKQEMEFAAFDVNKQRIEASPSM